MRSSRSISPALSRHRRTIASSAIAVGAVIGILTVTGLTAASASANVGEAGSGAPTALTVMAATASTTIRAESLSEIDADTQSTLASARAALIAASTVSSDIAASGLDIGAETTVDTAALRDQIERLSDLDVVPILFLPAMAEETGAETQAVLSQTTKLRGLLDAAQAKKAAEEAAAAAAAQAQREAEAAAAAAAAANTPDGAKATARQLAAERGWGADQFSCLESLWNRESNWNYQAYNAGSGATGIPQSLPGSKMASAGADWQTNATTQIRWGLGYIAGSYGTPCAAWGHSQSTGWY